MTRAYVNLLFCFIDFAVAWYAIDKGDRVLAYMMLAFGFFSLISAYLSYKVHQLKTWLESNRPTNPKG